MGDCHVDERNSPPVESPEQMAGRFQAELMTALPAWKAGLGADPGQLENIERAVHAAFARGADLVLVGLIAVVMKTPGFAAACERTRREAAIPLRAGRNRQVQVRLLGGLMMWVTSLYCAHRQRWFGKAHAPIPGLYVELAQFGFGKGCTPGLQGRVARQAALCPSLKFARQELNRHGVPLDLKAVRRITNQCGAGLLRLRTHELELWRTGELPAGVELAGKKVSVQIDGGRSRIRGKLRDAAPIAAGTTADGLRCDDGPGRSRKRPKRTYPAEWREPKLVTIFIHDEHGRMAPETLATVDGTFEGPDALAELVAMHLHRLGAAQAERVTFVGDGAVWIWDRIPRIVELAKLGSVPVDQVLDCCHAVHHIALALAACDLELEERMTCYRGYRSMLRNGYWRQVVTELTELAQDAANDSPVWTEIAYLQKHGAAGRLMYPTFKGRGQPIGSGAIESNIRRVLNLRMKGSGIFWLLENAEAMLQVRAQVLTDRWDARLRQMQALARRDPRTDWHWTPQAMSSVECAPQPPA